MPPAGMSKRQYKRLLRYDKNIDKRKAEKKAAKAKRRREKAAQREAAGIVRPSAAKKQRVSVHSPHLSTQSYTCAILTPQSYAIATDC